MHLKLRHLEVFHAVMEEGSISKAADRLFLTQPAISIALTKLEEMLGYSLFHRSKGHFEPRPEAYLLKQDAASAILAVEHFANRAHLVGEGRVGLIRVGALGLTSINLLPKLVAEFTERRPLLDIHMKVLPSSQVTHMVGNGQLDIGIVETPVTSPSLSARPVLLPGVCIMKESSPLADQKVITPQLLADQNLIGILDGNLMERQLQRLLSEAGIEYRPRIKGLMFAMVRRLVADGVGIAIVDAITGCLPMHDGVVWRPFEPAVKYEVALITKSGAIMSSLAEEFADQLYDRLIQRSAMPELQV
jgi:DNA-binding transcriptional LysR family regulator